MTTINHWGKWVDSETPVTGVISSNNIAWECIDNEICTTCEEIEKEIQECDTCPECGGDLLEIRPDYIECEEYLTEYDMDGAFEMVECFDHEKLMGDWKKDEDGLYEPDKTGEFAVIVTSSTFNCVQVVRSKWIAKNKRLCSPCFPGQADLDSENGEFICYALPKDLVSYEDYEVFEYGFREEVE